MVVELLAVAVVAGAETTDAERVGPKEPPAETGLEKTAGAGEVIAASVAGSRIVSSRTESENMSGAGGLRAAAWMSISGKSGWMRARARVLAGPAGS